MDKISQLGHLITKVSKSENQRGWKAVATSLSSKWRQKDEIWSKFVKLALAADNLVRHSAKI